jgi:hypothetical protein
MDRKQRKQKEREERLRKQGSQNNFRPFTHKDRQVGKKQIYLIIGLMVLASALVFYNMR